MKFLVKSIVMASILVVKTIEKKVYLIKSIIKATQLFIKCLHLVFEALRKHNRINANVFQQITDINRQKRCLVFTSLMSMFISNQTKPY